MYTVRAHCSWHLQLLGPYLCRGQNNGTVHLIFCIILSSHAIFAPISSAIFSFNSDQVNE